MGVAASSKNTAPSASCFNFIASFIPQTSFTKLMAKVTIDRIDDKSDLPVWARVVLVIIAFLFIGGIFQFFGALISGVSLKEMSAIKDISLDRHLVMQLSGFLGTMVVIYLFWCLIDKQPIKRLGFATQGIIADILLGLVVALVIIGGGTLILMAMGALTITSINVHVPSLLYTFALFIIVSLNEEILMRGYILNTLMMRYNRFVGLFVSSLLFALMHGMNANITWLSMLNLFLAGVILGSVYIYTRNLWFPISLHLFWNYLQGPVLGYAVSGMPIKSLVSHKIMGNDTLTGGLFGFEGSIVCSILVSLFALALILYYRKKEQALLAQRAAQPEAI